MPITLNKMQFDIIALSLGVVQLLPVKDELGREIVYYDTSRTKLSKGSKEIVVIFTSFHCFPCPN